MPLKVGIVQNLLKLLKYCNKLIIKNNKNIKFTLEIQIDNQINFLIFFYEYS